MNLIPVGSTRRLGGFISTPRRSAPPVQRKLNLGIEVPDSSLNSILSLRVLGLDPDSKIRSTELKDPRPRSRPVP
jgi:hypothetical protein